MFGRWAKRGFVAVSLVLTMAIIALSVRSFFWADAYYHSTSPRISSAGTELFAFSCTGSCILGFVQRGDWEASPGTFAFVPVDDMPTSGSTKLLPEHRSILMSDDGPLGLWSFSGHRYSFIRAADERAQSNTRRLIKFPFWLPTLLFMIPLLLSAFRYFRHRRRHTAGCCPVCGYDLRATPDRCPECGAAGSPTAVPA